MRSKPIPDNVIRAHQEHVCARRWSDQSSNRSGHLDLGLSQPNFNFKLNFLRTTMIRQGNAPFSKRFIKHLEQKFCHSFLNSKSGSFVSFQWTVVSTRNGGSGNRDSFCALIEDQFTKATYTFSVNDLVKCIQAEVLIAYPYEEVNL